MSDVKIHLRKPRLAALLRQPGGKSVARALLDAAESEAAKRERLDRLNTALDAIDAALAALPDAFDREGLRGLYDRINGLIGFSDAQRPELGHAAHALCDLLDRMAEQGFWDRAAIAARIEALRLLPR